MPGLLSDVDPDGLLEYSVVYTDRALNHMSKKFQGVMKDIAATLKRAYNARAAIVMPGSGSFGMEAVARQFATGRRVMIIRNGWFSYRWTQIFEMGTIPEEAIVLKAERAGTGAQEAFAPPAIAQVVSTIRDKRPALVFAPHVETASGIILPDAYLRAVADAVHSVGGLFVLDCVASGAIWVDMQATGVDILVSAPQKGWSGPAGCALVMLGEEARKAIDATTSSSFAADLKKWLAVMETYESGAHIYHTTMPTDSLARLREVMREAEGRGLDALKAQQQELGARVRALLAAKGFMSVAAPGFEAPGVVVCYTDDPDLQNGRKFIAQGLQTAAGVPLMCDEGADFRTFRIGLFGLDKWANVERSVKYIEAALNGIARG